MSIQSSIEGLGSNLLTIFPGALQPGRGIVSSGRGTAQSLKNEDVEVFVGNVSLDNFFKQDIVFLRENGTLIQLASNYITSDLLGLIKTQGVGFQNIEPQNFALLVEMTHEDIISSRGAKDILTFMFTAGGNPQKIAEKNGLLQKSNETELRVIAEKITQEHPLVVAEYRAGKERALQFLIGQGMKETKGAANPILLKKIFLAVFSKE